MKASDFLRKAADHMEDRAQQYDKADGEGERSMAATVAAFYNITGVPITESQGWLLMMLLKAVRANTGPYHQDSLEDMVAYASLSAEADYADNEASLPESGKHNREVR